MDQLFTEVGLLSQKSILKFHYPDWKGYQGMSERILTDSIMRRQRFFTLDALRGVAALIVVWFHLADAGWARGANVGYLAVDLFFLISGFVLAYRYDPRFSAGLSPSKFMKDRFIRLFPLFLIGLFIGIPLQLKGLYDGTTPGKVFVTSTVANLFMLPSPIISGEQRLFPSDTAAWSLFFELFVANLVFAAGWKLIRGRLLAGVIVFGAIGLVGCEHFYGELNGGSKWANAPVALFRVEFSFFLGVWLARRHLHKPASFSAPSWIFPTALTAILSLTPSGFANPLVELGLIFIVFPMMIFLGASAVERYTATGKTLGDISYGLYTIHLPLSLLVVTLFSSKLPNSFIVIAFVVLVALVAFILDKTYDPWARRRLHVWFNRVEGVFKGEVTLREFVLFVPLAIRWTTAVILVIGLGLSAFSYVSTLPKEFVPSSGRLTCLSSSGYSAGASPTGTYILHSDFLEELRLDPYTKNTSEYQVLIRRADAALNHEALSVVDKDLTPPSGDKHDYMSLSTYSWLDPNNPGKEIWRDGQRNPDVYTNKFDYSRLQSLVKDSEVLGLAYYYTKDTRYADKLAINLRRWFIEPSTRMTPNLHFAQLSADGKIDNGNGTIDSWHLVSVIEAIKLVGPSKALSESDIASLKEWFSSYLSWLQTSSQGLHEAAALNNHAVFHDIQRMEYALFTDQAQVAKDIARQSVKRLRQINYWGGLPQEESRAKSSFYLSVTMGALSLLANLDECSGVDLWRSRSVFGGNMRSMFDRVISFVKGERVWQGGVMPNRGPMAQSFEYAGWVYSDQRYLQAARELVRTSPGDDYAADEDFRWGELTVPNPTP